MTNPVICWFRQDLRLSDNPAWHAACQLARQSGAPVLPVYILDDENSGEWKMGAASRVWLHHSLKSLDKSLNEHLVIFKGSAKQILHDLAKDIHPQKIIWNRCYEPWRIARDKQIKDDLNACDIKTESHNGSLLWEPWEISKQDGTPYRVFTPYFRKGCLAADPPRTPLSAPKLPDFCPSEINAALSIDDLSLQPAKIRWDTPMLSYWDMGEQAAQNKLQKFLDTGLKGYKENRNYPALNQTSNLSPYLHFGEISPNQIWYAATESGTKNGYETDMDCFQSELGWREFSNSLLYYNQTLPESPLNRKFDHFEWEEPDGEMLEKWQQGQTGYPIIDAGMRELWATGYMHNRVRMIVASFLVKDLRYHWRYGENWFWDKLFDADLANNAASWQWVAGCGADAAPYFRIFNPTTQGEKFDPRQEYINRWAPDSHRLKPVLDHKKARDKALESYASL